MLSNHRFHRFNWLRTRIWENLTFLEWRLVWRQNLINNQQVWLPGLSPTEESRYWTGGGPTGLVPLGRGRDRNLPPSTSGWLLSQPLRVSIFLQDDVILGESVFHVLLLPSPLFFLLGFLFIVDLPPFSILLNWELSVKC